MTFVGIVIPLPLFDHDRFGKSIATFPDPALAGSQGCPQGLIRQQVVKIGDRLNKTVLELHPWSPGEFLIGHGNIWTPLARVVLRKWLVDDLGG